jgi:uncharacterized membrane protein YfcA
MPVVLGVLPGSMLGSRILARSPLRTLRLIFTIAISAMGIEMIFNGLTGRF